MVMTLLLYDNKIGRTWVERKYTNAYFVNHGDIKECITYLKPPYGNRFYHEICFESVHIGFGNISLYHKILLYFEADVKTFIHAYLILDNFEGP